MANMLKLLALPAFDDNYLWVLENGSQALVVDPGDAAPVLTLLARTGLSLAAILVTHHHGDHTGGVAALREASGATVYGPASERIPAPFIPLQENDTLTALGVEWRVLDVPGHTSGHIAFYADDVNGKPLLFCGDTLFSGGCGRLFEGTPAQMLASLDKLSALPGNTVVCCTHEYTLSNLRFALAVEPGNQDLQTYHAECVKLRAAGESTLPTSIANEHRINPFLRSRQPAVEAAAHQFDPAANGDVAVFAALRQWKNQFK
jgi:hydroxyacylglutathione hydrolase